MIFISGELVAAEIDIPILFLDAMTTTDETAAEAHICVRCMRKQYKVAMGLIALGLVFFQVFYDVFEYMKSLKIVEHIWSNRKSE